MVSITARDLRPGYTIQLGSRAVTVSFVQEVVQPEHEVSHIFIYENGELVSAVSPYTEFELLSAG